MDMVYTQSTWNIIHGVCLCIVDLNVFDASTLLEKSSYNHMVAKGMFSTDYTIVEETDFIAHGPSSLEHVFFTLLVVLYWLLPC
jgi:hypothetical protein